MKLGAYHTLELELQRAFTLHKVGMRWEVRCEGGGSSPLFAAAAFEGFFQGAHAGWGGEALCLTM